MKSPLIQPWGETIARSNFGATSLAGLDTLSRGQRAALALSLGAGRLDGDVVNLNLEAAPNLVDEHMPANRLIRVRFDIETGQTVSDLGSPWALGLVGLASHVWRITSRRPVNPFEAGNRLLTCLGAAALRAGVE